MVLLHEQAHHHHDGMQRLAPAPSSPPAPASGSPSTLPFSMILAAEGSGRGQSPLAILLQADEELRRRAAVAASAPVAAPAAAPVAAARPTNTAVDAATAIAAMAPPVGAGPDPVTLSPPSAIALGPMPPPLSFGALAGEPITAVLPGVTEARVGLLPGMRTPAMLKFNGEVPKQKRKPPTDLSGLTDEQKVERRKQQARQYSKRARVRGSEMKAELTAEVEALRFVRDLFEKAPHVCMVLSGDVRHTTVLYANKAADTVLRLGPKEMLGRPFWELVQEKDHNRLYSVLGQLVLTRNGMARIRCGIRTSFADYFLPMDVTLKYGSLGVVCSLWPSAQG